MARLAKPKRNTKETRRGIDGVKLEKIKTDCIGVDSKTSAQLFQIHVTLYKCIYNTRKSSFFDDVAAILPIKDWVLCQFEI